MCLKLTIQKTNPQEAGGSNQMTNQHTDRGGMPPGAKKTHKQEAGRVSRKRREMYRWISRIIWKSIHCPLASQSFLSHLFI